MTDVIQAIKERVDLLDFLKGYLKISPAGKNYKAACPFHKEKTPSFIISPDRGIWHCFGCAAGGDVIKFLMLYENLEFYDALKILAEKAGLDLRSLGNRDLNSHNNLYRIMEAAKEIFKKELSQSAAEKKYLSERGLLPETVEAFEIGLAPAGSDATMRGLLKQGYNLADLEKAGLVIKTDRGTYWDRFRGRIMFPLYNHFGKVIGFTGRILPGHENENVGKYVNSPETPIFQKSKVLYGFHKTKNDIRQINAAVVVEGQMDFLMAWQDGVKNAVATSGTALTQDHLAVLRRLSDSLVLGFDSDEAGVAAAERVIDLAGSLDFNVKVLLNNGFKDPADLAQKEPGKLKELIAAALPAMQYYFYKYLNSLNGGQIIEKKRGIRAVLGKIGILGSALERDHWLKELSGLTGVEESVLVEEMSKLKIAGPVSLAEDAALPAEAVSRKDLICQRIIGLALNNQDFKIQVGPYLEYFPGIYKGISAKLIKSGEAGAGQEAPEEVVDLIQLRAVFEGLNFDEKKTVKEFQDLLRQLKIEYFKERRQKLAEDIRIAETGGNEPRLTECLKEYRLVCQELQDL